IFFQVIQLFGRPFIQAPSAKPLISRVISVFQEKFLGSPIVYIAKEPVGFKAFRIARRPPVGTEIRNVQETFRPDSPHGITEVMPPYISMPFPFGKDFGSRLFTFPSFE